MRPRIVAADGALLELKGISVPSRIIREGILDSEKIARAGEGAEVMFTRLMLIADDFGRFDGRLSVIWRRCWPLGGIQEADASKRLAALCREGLVIAYEVDGKPFIEIPNFGQRTRAQKSKYPAPLTDVRQMPDKCPSTVRPLRTESESESESELHRKQRKTPIPKDFAVSESTRQWASKNGFVKFLPAHLDYFKDYAASSGKTYADWDAAFRNSVKGDWGGVRKNFKPDPFAGLA